MFASVVWGVGTVGALLFLVGGVTALALSSWVWNPQNKRSTGNQYLDSIRRLHGLQLQKARRVAIRVSAAAVVIGLALCAFNLALHGEHWAKS